MILKDKIIFVPNCQIYVGLYPYILKCEDNNVQVVDATKIQDTKVDDSKVDAFIKPLNIPFAVRDYQKEHLYMQLKRIVFITFTHAQMKISYYLSSC